EFLGSGISDNDMDRFLDDEDDFDSGTFVPLAATQGGPSSILLGIGLLVLLLLFGGAATGLVLWTKGMGRLPLVAQPYAKMVRLATWCGVGPRPSQTPYEYGREL